MVRKYVPPLLSHLGKREEIERLKAERDAAVEALKEILALPSYAGGEALAWCQNIAIAALKGGDDA